MSLRLKDLLEPPEGADPAWFQRRGRSFERVLKQMFELEGMAPRASMRPSGEEIDGSFSMDDRFFLLEAKWHTPPIAASALYAFKGKVDGKLVGTIGAFFSMSDYSAEAVDALLYGKELNLILFGRQDLLLIEDKQISMREAIRVKLRYASEYGQPFFDLSTHLAEQARLGAEASISKPQREWTIIVEGVDDVRTIQELLARFVIPAKVTVFPAGGQLSVAPLAVHASATHRQSTCGSHRHSDPGRGCAAGTNGRTPAQRRYPGSPAPLARGLAGQLCQCGLLQHKHDAFESGRENGTSVCPQCRARPIVDRHAILCRAVRATRGAPGKRAICRESAPLKLLTLRANHE